MLSTILSWLSGGVINQVTDALTDAYRAKLTAQNNTEKLEAEMTISQLEARQRVLLAEQGRWYTAWIRPALAAPVVLFVWKIIVWDTILGWGVTPNPGDIVNWIVVTTIGAYFLTRPFERK